MVKFPEGLDNDTELYHVENGIDDILAEHHNALKDAIKAIEEKIGVDGSAIVNSIDYILKHAVILSDPPNGKKRVIKIYYDPDIGKYAIEREE